MYLTSIVHLEEDHYVALCPELDVVSQGDSPDEAAANLQEACELFLEYACEEEVSGRLRSPVHISYFEAGADAAGSRPSRGDDGGGEA